SQQAPAPAPQPAAQTEPAPEAPAVPAFSFVGGEEAYEDIPISQMRKTIARRLSESKFSAPHFYLTVEINMGKAIKWRKRLNEAAPVKISFNDLIVKACAAALRQHPAVNSSWLGEQGVIRRHRNVHIGVAVAVEEGLLVPVIRHADMKSLSQINVEIRALAEKARQRKLQPDEMSGNTFTVSNLGMFGIEEFTAIINPPDACILAVGGILEKPIVVDGEIKPGHTMKVTLSCDHRVVDGATGAQFLQTLKGILEDPIRLLV
ncbi:MAG: 2-oxo acid dehydrogenase subunit E2, partial [Bacteroidetes bacterium]